MTPRAKARALGAPETYTAHANLDDVADDWQAWFEALAPDIDELTPASATAAFEGDEEP